MDVGSDIRGPASAAGVNQNKMQIWRRTDQSFIIQDRYSGIRAGRGEVGRVLRGRVGPARGVGGELGRSGTINATPEASVRSEADATAEVGAGAARGVARTTRRPRTPRPVNPGAATQDAVLAAIGAARVGHV